MLIPGIYYSDWKRRKLSRMRLDEGADLAGGGATATEAAPVDTQTASTTEPVDATHADGTTPVVDDAEAMWGDLKPDEPVVGATETVIPPEFSKMFELSDYVKNPEQLSTAVQVADRMLQVQDGKLHVGYLINDLRTKVGEQAFDSIIRQQMIPYIEGISGTKFGAPPAEDPDRPMTVAEYQQRQRDDQLRTQQEQTTQAQQREQQAQVQRAHQVTGQHLEGLIKSGNGIFDGNVNGAMDSIAAQLPKLGITSDDLMKQVLAGNMTTLEKAYKAAEKAKTLEVKAYADAVKKRYATLKGAVPASKGGSVTATGAPTDGHDMSTQSGRAKWMAEQFKAGN